MNHSASFFMPRQRGLTLVELLVALALGMLIATAAVATLIVARQGFRSVDTGAQLRENARLAATLIQRVVVQAGFENAAYGFYTDPKDAGLRGYDNAWIGNVSGSTGPSYAHDSRTGCTQTDTSCANGSDMLVVRYWGASRNGTADGSIVNCAGRAEPEGTDRAISIFHVVRSSSGEPTLACTFSTVTGGVTTWTTVPLVTGVEGFQLLYGVDTQNGATVAASPSAGDTVADRYLTARQLDTIPSSTVAENWQRVRSVRIGLLIRGSSADSVAPAQVDTPVLGAGLTDPLVDIGSTLRTPADGRVRHSMIFTVHLRNAQYAYPSP